MRHSLVCILSVRRALLPRMTNCLDLWTRTAAFHEALLPANLNGLNGQSAWPQLRSSLTRKRPINAIMARARISQCEDVCSSGPFPSANVQSQNFYLSKKSTNVNLSPAVEGHCRAINHDLVYK